MKTLTNSPMTEKLEARLETRTPGGGEMKTKQAEKDAADVNVIVANYGKTGVLPPPVNPGIYQDNSYAVDLQQALEIMREATSMFEALPSQVREVANNQPLQFAMMMATPEGVEALKAAGLPVQPTSEMTPIKEEIQALRKQLREDYLPPSQKTGVS